MVPSPPTTPTTPPPPPPTCRPPPRLASLSTPSESTLLVWPSPSTTTARGRRRCLTPLPTWSPTPTVLLPPSTPMLLLPPPTTTPLRPPMATTPSLAPPTSTLLPLWCTAARSVRPRSL